MNKELEALDRVYDAVGDCEIGSRYYDLELPKDIAAIRKALEEKEKQDRLLEVLFKALKNKYIYVKRDKDLAVYKYDVSILNINLKEKYFEFIAFRTINGSYESIENIYFKDYGSTWALTREELE